MRRGDAAMRKRGGEASCPVPELGRDRCESNAVERGGEHVALCLGQAVVDDDDIGVEAGVVLQEGADGDQGAGDEVLGGRRGQADPCAARRDRMASTRS